MGMDNAVVGRCRELGSVTDAWVESAPTHKGDRGWQQEPEQSKVGPLRNSARSLASHPPLHRARRKKRRKEGRVQTQRWGLHRPNARSKSGRQAGGFSSEQVASGSLLLPLTHSAQRRHAVSSCPPGSDRPHHPALSCHLLACVLSTSRDQTCDETSLRTLENTKS